MQNLFFCECFKNLWDFLFLEMFFLCCFLFTSLSKVHLKVEYRDWHTAVLFGAISNMLASLTKKKKHAKDHFSTPFWKSDELNPSQCSVMISTFCRQCEDLHQGYLKYISFSFTKIFSVFTFFFWTIDGTIKGTFALFGEMTTYMSQLF